MSQHILCPYNTYTTADIKSLTTKTVLLKKQNKKIWECSFQKYRGVGSSCHFMAYLEWIDQQQ